ncbi:S8 family peptidase [Streptomyces sp. NBC_00885]|uniref:S8 family peptidase n=1 Tax=Streptomyces sp. NBC_00885 TaxID=2975857 RepID=UPI00386B7D52|nr:S8 family peptidase [Streptomyces sp. NBC_00885]
MNPHRKPRRARILVAAALGSTLLGIGAVATAMAGEESSESRAGAALASPKSAASAAQQTGGLIVGYKPKAPQAHSDKAVREDTQAIAAQAGEKLSYDRRLGTGAALVDLGGVQPAKDVAVLMDRFRADPDVAYVVPDRRVQAVKSQDVADTDVPDGGDTRTGDGDFFPEQWNLSEAKAGMDVPDAWKSSTGQGVTVAVLDTGITEHSDLAANTVAGFDFITDTFSANDGDGRDGDPTDPGDATKPGDCGGQSTTPSSWHGTHVAGIVAAPANGKGVAGVAPGVKVQPVRVLGRCSTPNSDIIDAITWASGGPVNGVPDNKTPAQVINMSLGLVGPCDEAMQSAVDGAVERGTTIVVAAGNRGTLPAPQDAGNFDWASCNNVITVAATDRDGNKAEYSNFGDVVDIAAPGGDMRQDPANGILSTFNSGTIEPGAENFKFEVGTSQAAPHIAGLAALMKATNPALTPAQIESAILANARPLPGTCEGGCGAGLADAAKTVESVSNGAAPPADSSSSPPSAPSSPPPSPSPSAGNGQAADGTDLSACFDNTCEVEVTGGDTIKLDGTAGVDEFTVDSVADNTLTFTASSGNGTQQSSGSQTSPGRSTIDDLVVDLISIDGDRATIQLS